MVITWKRDEGNATYNGVIVPIVCDVRNEINGRRKLTEPVVYTENEDCTQGMPYMPRLFPKGVWKILAIIPKDDPYEAPFFISTNAHQSVVPWTSDNGHYGRAMADSVEDYGYGLHNSTSETTLGCGRILNYYDLIELINAIRKETVVYLDVQ
jgi:hypothetical protein